MLALILATVMLVMTCTYAVAGTIFVEPSVDQEAVNNLAAGFGVPEEQMGMVGPVLAIVNALGIKVGLFDDGAQVDLDLNGKEALTLGLAMGEEGATVVSTLFPNYIVTAKNETIDIADSYTTGELILAWFNRNNINAVRDAFDNGKKE